MKYDLQLCIGTRLRRLSRIADGYFRTHIADFDITENQMSILFFLKKIGAIEQGKIGENLALQRSTVSRNIRLLEKKNYVKSTNNYRPEIELSQKGNELVSMLLPIWENIMDELIEKIGTSGMEHISELEKKIN
nr:MarR family transcriptional regulator [uncultured Allomuricauda sp.]